MKLAFTVSNPDHYMHAGGEIERKTSIISIEDASLPRIVQEYLDLKNKDPHRCYLSMSISVVEDNQ